MINIVKTRRIWLTFSTVMFVLAVIAISVWGLRFGIDFTGGSILEVEYAQDVPSLDTIRSQIEPLNIGDVDVKGSGEKGVILRFKEVDQPIHQAIIDALHASGDLTENSFDSIGPVIGNELRTKSTWAIGIALVLILAYISYVFRKVSHTVASWKYGVIAIVALLHDVIFVIGIFSVLGQFAGIEITAAFIAAFLTVLGYSVNDTIVVFDRIRENLLKRGGQFEDVVSMSLNQTIMRSLNMSATVILVLLAIILFGGETLQYFALALLLGVAVGTYSSIFVASPLLVVWHNYTRRIKHRT
ncbi:MAG: protein translocase subunit SecF [bacterium]|nr:protein translocase subunit SecF [bacterium]